MISPEDYIEQRLNDQIGWYDRKSGTNQRWFKRLRFAEIVAAATIPFLSGFADKWIEYRATAESLRKEKFLFLTQTEPYDKADAFHLLVQRVEGLLSKESIEWVQSMMKAPKAEGRA
jgi:hypothetical protein